MRQSARAQPPCLRAAAPPGFAGPQTAGALADATVEPPTPLQLEVTRLGRWLELAVLLIAAVVATLLLLAPVHSLADAVPVLLLAVSLATRCAPWRWPTVPWGAVRPRQPPPTTPLQARRRPMRWSRAWC